jgi:hypothetical protein
MNLGGRTEHAREVSHVDMVPMDHTQYGLHAPSRFFSCPLRAEPGSSFTEMMPTTTFCFQPAETPIRCCRE